MKNKSWIIANLALVVFFVILFTSRNASVDETITVEFEAIPEGMPELSGEWNSPFGLVWSKGAVPLEYIGAVNGTNVMTLSIAPYDPITYEPIGMSRFDAVQQYGQPITALNTLNISDFNNDSLCAFKQDDDIIILFFDTVLDIAVFSCTIDPSFAETTRLFTKEIDETFSCKSYEPLIFDMINALRASYSKNPFSGDYRLHSLASTYSTQMADQNFFGHVTPNGEILDDRMKASGIPYTVAGENLCAGQTTPMDVIVAWLNSPPHREVLLGDYDAAGIGVAVSDHRYHVYYSLEAIIY